MKRPGRAMLLLALACPALPAPAQSLYTVRHPVPVNERGEFEVSAPLYDRSMIVVRPPRPRLFEKHQLITIIVDESSRATAEQSLETEKKYNLDAALTHFPSLEQLLELQIENGDSEGQALLELANRHKYEGDGTYERQDRLVARITAEIIDVKPNGLLVLEARKHIEKDEEKQTMILSGMCRQEDITQNNTVASSQLADLSLVVHHEGRVREAARKGLIPRVLEAIFAF